MAIQGNRHRSCTTKHIYYTKHMAWSTVLYLVNRVGAPIWQYKVYHCIYCDKWHIGHIKRYLRRKR